MLTPHEWERVPFGRLVERSREAGRPDLRPLSVFLDEGVVPRSSRSDNYNRLGSNLAKYLVVRPGDVVFNKLRTWQGGLGVSHYRGIVSPAYFVCRPSPRVNSRYLHYLLRSAPYLAELTRVSKFMPPSQFDILWDDLRALPTLVPEPGVQAEIAKYLDTETSRIDTLITKKRRMIELLEERWVADVVGATTGPASDCEGVALRRVIDSAIGGSWGNESGASDLDAVCVRGTDFNTTDLTANQASAPMRSFTYGDFRRRKLLDGDLVIEKSGGGDKHPVGRVVQWCGDDAGVPTNFAARLRPEAGVHSRYLTFLLRAAYETDRTRRWIKQTTGIQNLDLGGFLSEKFAVPPLPDQSAVASRLDEATRHRVRTEALFDKQIGVLRERRQALITAAVTGELAVSEGVA